MKIKDIMYQDVITIEEDTSPIEAFEKMYKNGVRRLFVMNKEGTPVGVVSHSDLIGALDQIKDSEGNTKKETISDIMTPNIVTINAQEEIKNAANLMLRADVSGLLALDKKKPVGVITKTDICRLVAASFLVPKEDK